MPSAEVECSDSAWPRQGMPSCPGEATPSRPYGDSIDTRCNSTDTDTRFVPGSILTPYRVLPRWLRVVRVPDSLSLNSTKPAFSTTVPDITTRPPLVEPATRPVVHVIWYVPSSLIWHSMSPWIRPKSPVWTWSKAPRHVPASLLPFADATAPS